MPTSKRNRPAKLRPTGHSATIEALIQPAIVVGSTIMSAIAAYVLAKDEISRILDALSRHATPALMDAFVVILCAGMGFLIDMAIIVSATRYKMHAVRADPKEQRWLTLAKWVLTIGLASETLTLFYFFVNLDPAQFPFWMVEIANFIHSMLTIARAFLPPIVIAYFAAGVLPVMFDRADRNREIKARTSSNVMTLIDRLSEVEETDDKTEQLRALGGQLLLATYAEYDETGRTTEEEQLRRDAKLVNHLARMHGLDWNAIAADVAPELTAPTPPTPPTPPAPALPPAPRIVIEERPQPSGSSQVFSLPEPEPPASRPRQGRPTRGARRTSASGGPGVIARAAGSAGSAGSAAQADTSARPVLDRAELRRRREESAAYILSSLTPEEREHMTYAKLAQQIAVRTRHHCSESTAGEIARNLKAHLGAESHESSGSSESSESSEGGVA